MVSGMSSYFELVERPIITVTSPTSGQTCYLDSDITVEWTISGQIKPYDGVKISLVKGNTEITWLSEQTVDDGSEIVHLDGELTPGSDYKIRIYTKDNHNNYGDSSYFTVTEYTEQNYPSIGLVTGEIDPIEEDRDQHLTCSILDTSGSGLDWARIYYRTSTQLWSSNRYLSFSGDNAVISKSLFTEGDKIYYYIGAKDNDNNYNFRGASGTTPSEEIAKSNAFSFSVISNQDSSNDESESTPIQDDESDKSLNIFKVNLQIISIIIGIIGGILGIFYKIRKISKSNR